MTNLNLRALFAVFAGLIAPVAHADLAPSEVTTLIRQAMLHQPDAERTSLTQPIVARMRTTNLSDIEQFHKGEVHFLNFEPEPSRDEFWKFRNRDDNFGRVALQRLMLIRINAFDMVDTVIDQDIPAYRERFEIRPGDRYGISFAIRQAATQLINRGDVERALDLVSDEVTRHDRFDGPYIAYRLPGQFLDVAEEHGRGDEFRALQEDVLRGLDDAITRRLNADVPKVDTEVELPGVVFVSLFEDQTFDEYEWTAEFLKLRAAISGQ